MISSGIMPPQWFLLMTYPLRGSLISNLLLFFGGARQGLTTGKSPRGPRLLERGESSPGDDL